MLDFLQSLSDLASLRTMPWRWWVSIVLGLGGMIVILMNVQGDIAVLYIFLDLILSIVVAAIWQGFADRKPRGRGAGQ